MNNLVLNRLFTQNVFDDLLEDKENTTYGAIVNRYIQNIEAKNNGELISEIYEFMAKSYRNQYFYQNTLLNKLLLGKHSIRTTTALSQIPIGKSKADFILINGNAVVYEIKSERDSFERLETQLNDYFKAFNYVCVLTSEHHYDRLSNILRDTPVGIYVLTKNDTISANLKKEPIEENKYLDHLTIFKILRKGEYESILKNHYGRLPNATPVFYYDACYALFSKIPILEAYKMVLKELKNRNRVVSNKLNEVPYELKSLVYFSNLSEKNFDALRHFLNKSFRG